MADRASVTTALLTLGEAARSGVIRATDGERVRSVLEVAVSGGSTDLRRALVDVTSADVGGLAAPGYLPLPGPPPSRLLSMARPLGSVDGLGPDGSFVYVVPHVTALPAANVDVPEKTDPTQTGRVTITDRALNGHTLDVRVDVSAAVEQRSRQPDAINAELTGVVVRAAELAIMSDLTAQATGLATDVVGAVAIAATYGGGPVVVLTDAATWATAAAQLAPLMAASPGSLVVIPVGGATGTVVFPAADAMIYTGDLTRLRRFDAEKLGYDQALALMVVAAFGHDGYATAIATVP